MLNENKYGERFSKFLNALIQIEKAVNDFSCDIAEVPPRFPADGFVYKDALDGFSFSSIKDDPEFYEKVASFFKGAVRPESNNFLLNIHPNPDIEATATACLALYYNIDGLMDEYAGEALLVEQLIARELGAWAGWASACGTATAGGKMTNLHALRTALSQITPGYIKTGIQTETVILASEGSHYSLKYATRDLGLGSDNCWFVPMNDNYCMDCTALDLTLRKAWDEGYTVAAIVCCGGSTINFHCDNLIDVYNTVIRAKQDYPNIKMPYLHLDSVIGWQYLSLDSFFEKDTDFNISDEIKSRITQVSARLNGIKHFDSFAVDFHKNGLCPSSSSFFIAKSDSFMHSLSLESETEPFMNASLGQHRPFKYTLENSRTMQGVAAAWGILNRHGRHGIAKYLIELHTARENFEKALKEIELFEVEKQNSLGWEVVCRIKTKGSSEWNIRNFIAYCNELTYKGHNVPLLGFTPGKNEDKLLIYSMRFYSSKEAAAVVANIEKVWYEFLTSDINGKKQIQYFQEDPIR